MHRVKHAQIELFCVNVCVHVCLCVYNIHEEKLFHCYIHLNYYLYKIGAFLNGKVLFCAYLTVIWRKKFFMLLALVPSHV